MTEELLFDLAHPPFSILGPASGLRFDRQRKNLFVYNNWHNGDQMLLRPLYMSLKQSQRFNIIIGVHSNTAYLFEDLCDDHCMIYASTRTDFGNYGPDLSYMVPPEFTAVNCWLGQYPDTQAHTWGSTVTMFNYKSEELSLGFQIPFSNNAIPMIDWDAPEQSSIDGVSIYLDNSWTRAGHSKFEFDLPMLAQAFPEVRFFTTAAPGDKQLSNIIDKSRLNLIELSKLSDQCQIILGKGSGPFLCTYTENNRFKPRAVCGYRLSKWQRFWEYPMNPLQYIETNRDLLKFLEVEVDKAVPRQRDVVNGREAPPPGDFTNHPPEANP